jgi:LPXTG-motif cell wall-anchored protein
VKSSLKQTGTKHKLLFLFLAALLFTVPFSSIASEVLAQETVETDPEYFMGMLILESQQQAILDAIRKVKDLQLGNLVILHPLDQGWDLTLIEEAIREADSLGLFTMFEPFNFSDHEIRISPEQFASWKEKYPHLLGIIVSEITGKQADLNLWLDNSTGTISTRLQAEQALVETITSRMQLAEYKDNGARIFLQENVIGYAAANTSYCDVFISKVFNAPNTEMMIGLARGMQKTYDIPAWGLFVDTWREWMLPPADFSASDVERALYEGWFYGAKYFFFEQGCFFGTLDREWPRKYFILDRDGTLSDYGKVIQRFYAFLRNANKMGYEQPDYSPSVAVMLGQSGWSSRGQDWGFWDQHERHGDLDYSLLNLFFPGVGDNWQIGGARTGKEFTGLPFGMVDIITVYAPPSVLKQYEIVVGLGWSLMTDTLADNIEDYVQDGGVFLSFLTFTHSNETEDELRDAYAWTESFVSLFGVSVSTPAASQGDVTADTFLHKITFTEDTAWYPWSGKTYSYFDPDETECWFWKFKYELSDSRNTRVLAWVNGIQSDYNAFIVENKLGAGYTYMVNTRNSNSLPNGVLTDVLTDFIHRLCTYHGRITVYAPYPRTEYWLSQGQSDRAVYLLHDNSTATQNFTYYVRPMDAGLNLDKKHIIFEYLNSEFYGVTEENIVPINVTLHTDEAKLFLLLEDDGEPQVLYSDALLTAAPIFTDHRLTVAIEGIEEAANTTKIFCSDFGRPRYILGLPFSLAQVYDAETSMLTFVSDSDITVGWNNVMDCSVLSSTVSLAEFSWDSTRGVLSVSAKGTAGQQGSMQVQMGGTEPYYLKVDDEEISTWSYDDSTGILSANFSFTSETAEVVFGFKQLEVDRQFVSDARADVGSAQTAGFHVEWMRNGSDVAGATVEVNGTEYVTNQTGWVSFDASNDSVGRVDWSITDVEYDGVTDYAESVTDLSIIWDRVNVTDSSVIDDVVQAGSLITVWLKAEYEYDSALFDNTGGTIFLNGEPMTWSNQNSRWEYNATSNILGPQMYEVTAVDDESFGLTTFRNQNENMEIIWDKIEVTKTEFETSALGATTVKVHVAYDYTKNPVVNADVSVNGKACNQIAQGIYGCKITDWSPFQSFLVEVDYPDFEQATKTVSNIHASNTTLYAVIGSAILLTAAVFVFRRKRRKQKSETVSSDTPPNITLLSVNSRKRGWVE